MSDQSVIQPLCSVIMPAYNCEQYIAKAISSVLTQTYHNIEIVVIDDCSTDSTWQIIKQLSQTHNQIKSMQNPANMGVAKTRERGIQRSCGSYVAFLDGDDIWLENKLQLQVEKLEATKADLCCSAYSLIDAYDQPLGRTVSVPLDPTFNKLLKENYIGCSTAIFRRKIASDVHMRSEYAHEDYVFWLECMRSGYKFVTVTLPLVQYRILPSSRSANKLQAASNRWKIYRHFLKYNPIKSFYYFGCYATSSLFRRLR